MTTTTRTHKTEIKTMNTTNKGANVDALEALKARLAEQGEQVNNTTCAPRERRSKLWVDSAEGNNTFVEAILVLALEHVEFKSAKVAVGGRWEAVTTDNYNDLKDLKVEIMTFVDHNMVCDEDEYTEIQIGTEGDYYVAQAKVNMGGCLSEYYSGVEHTVSVDAVVRYAEGKSLVGVIKTALEKVRRRSKNVKIMAMTPAE